MLTIEKLTTFGADVEDGLARCMGNQNFYFMLIGKVFEDKNFDLLEQALAENNLGTAFEAAHSLKGVLGNLALAPIYTPVSELTELLRNKSDADYMSYLQKIKEKRAELENLMNN